MPPPPKKKVKLTMDSFGLPKELLKIIVGNETEFFINKDLICSKSDFFMSTCRTHCVAGKSNLVELVKGSPRIFGIFLVWVATADIADSADLEPTPTSITMSDSKARIFQLMNCYCLGEFLQAPGFQNHVMDYIIQSLKLFATVFKEHSALIFTSPSDIEVVYGEFREKSKLRKVIIDYHISLYSAPEGWLLFDSHLNDILPFFWSKEYMKDMLLVTVHRLGLQKGKPLPPWKQSPCRYHEPALGRSDICACQDNKAVKEVD